MTPSCIEGISGSGTNTHDGVTFIIVDTPGLCDDLPEVGNDKRYLDLMKSQIQEIDSFWYVVPLDETRLTSDDRRGIKLISEAFGHKVWDRCVIVFTFADKLNQAEYIEALRERTRLVQREIEKYASVVTAFIIPSVAVPNTKPTTPDGKPWLGELFTVVVKRCSDTGTVPLLVAMKEDLHPTKKPVGGTEPRKPRIELTSDQKKEVSKTLFERVLQSAVAGAGAGAKIGARWGWVGAAIGAGIGAFSSGVVGGFLSWLFEE